jgi:hypothetical protein
LVAEEFATTKYDYLPPNIIAESKRAVLDWLGSAIEINKEVNT